MIEYYLGEKPLLANVDTYRCWLDDEREEVLDRVSELVIKPVEGSGGYGIVFGPEASEKELAAVSKKIRDDPRSWIAQPMMELSTVPTQIGSSLAPRYVDLRPFAVNDGNEVWVLPGGLTRVALVEGSRVVNSSQGGGSKNTWVLASSRAAAADRELGAAEIVRSLPKSMTDPAPDGAQSNGEHPHEATAPKKQKQKQQQEQQQKQRVVR
ncbi:MAG TPA: circularly permuted type 2 ATP-grasp protein, partial [Mycobacterium sp.]